MLSRPPQASPPSFSLSKKIISTSLVKGVSPLPTGYDWPGDAPLVRLDSDGYRPVVET